MCRGRRRKGFKEMGDAPPDSRCDKEEILLQHSRQPQRKEDGGRWTGASPSQRQGQERVTGPYKPSRINEDRTKIR